jgi:hypothetical protein
LSQIEAERAISYHTIKNIFVGCGNPNICVIYTKCCKNSTSMMLKYIKERVEPDG